ncbi:MAG: pyruvate dehydrogenase (acetyl-transferring) E1 component subunit alpha [Candidatus Geothermarchaeales archaeon]
MTSQTLTILGSDGRYDEKKEPELSQGELTTLYRFMVLTRELNDRCMTLQRQGRIGFFVPCLGQEAAQIGSAYALQPGDWIFPAYREPGVALMRGVPLRSLFAQYFGNKNDRHRGRRMPSLFGFKEAKFVNPSAPIATQIPHAVGAAWAAKLRRENIVTLVYFGDGATSANDFHAGMNFAGVFGTPTIFFCQNNQFAISLRVERQTAAESLADKAKAYGFPGMRVDGNDILAVYYATKKAADRARRDDGPTMIEAVTYRMGPHSTSDDPTRYRDEREVEEWRKKDPIIRFRLYLEKKGWWGEEREKALWDDVRGEIREAVGAEEGVAEPDVETLFDDVFHVMPWNLREQRDELLGILRDAEEKG